jgi:hypothetical protein
VIGMQRLTIRKDRDTGRWIATRHRFGFTGGLETKQHPTRAEALDWIYRRQPGTPMTVLERADPRTDGIGPIPVWSPLWHQL